jgi:hypothetical protein
MFRRRFWVSLALSVPTILYSSMVQDWLSYRAPDFRGSTLVAPLFGTLVFAWGGPVFLRAGWDELRARRPGMMLLISMGLVVAFGASVATEVGWIDVDLWFELATLVTIMLLGHWLDMPAIDERRARWPPWRPSFPTLPSALSAIAPRRQRSTRFASATWCSCDPEGEFRRTASLSPAKPSSTRP